LLTWRFQVSLNRIHYLITHDRIAFGLGGSPGNKPYAKAVSSLVAQRYTPRAPYTYSYCRVRRSMRVIQISEDAEDNLFSWVPTF
jgi:hypothetical protein